jgi:histidyl-tRNA synthetase
MDLSLPRGIRDIEPDEYEIHERIRTVFFETAQIYNFRLMEPAPIETLPVLRAKSGEAVDKEIYAFQDKAGREIGLRFDLTVGMTRYVATHRELKPPIKLASYGGAWRYDEPQYGKYRWFSQCDAEIFGSSSVEADAEVIDLIYNFFGRLGLANVTVHVSDRSVVEEYVRKILGMESEKLIVEMLRALDKVQKKSEADLLQEYEGKGVDKENLKKLLEFGKLRGKPGAILSELSELNLQSTANLKQLETSLKARGVTRLEYDMSVVRGIDYYTGIVFEVIDDSNPRLGSLCGGGRYDILPRIFGRDDLPATGAAPGVERIAMSLKRESSPNQVSAAVVYTDASLFSAALKILAALRGAGVRSEIGTQGKNLSKQLEEANAIGFEWAVILGKKESESGVVTLKSLRERKESQVPLELALRTIKGEN